MQEIERFKKLKEEHEKYYYLFPERWKLMVNHSLVRECQALVDAGRAFWDRGLPYDEAYKIQKPNQKIDWKTVQLNVRKFYGTTKAAV